MEKKTKIVVLHMKELIYTGIFVALGIVLIVLLIFMFMPDDEKKDETPAVSEYVAGVYSTSVMLNGSTFDVEVTVDGNYINSIELNHVSEEITNMYPLLQPTLDKLSQQIYVDQSTENITYEEENKYTSMVLLNAINSSLQKAQIP